MWTLVHGDLEVDLMHEMLLHGCSQAPFRGSLVSPCTCCITNRQLLGVRVLSLQPLQAFSDTKVSN